MTHRIRILSGPYAGREGWPHARTAGGRYSVEFDDGSVAWFNKDQIHTLHCMLLNCRGYTDNPGHNYCSKCKVRRSGRPTPPPEPEPSNFLEEIMQIAVKADKANKEMDEIIDVMEKIKRGNIPMTRKVIRRLCEQLRSATPQFFGPGISGPIEKIVKEMEEMVGDGETVKEKP